MSTEHLCETACMVDWAANVTWSSLEPGGSKYQKCDWWIRQPSILSDRTANQSNQIQTHSQMCHRSTGHSYCTQTCKFYSISQQNLTVTKVIFYKTIFSLCYIPLVSIETPLRMTTVLFCSGGGSGGSYFLCVNVKSQNSTRRVSILCVLY
jgi:hypothetical protein